ncbi:hypothetical protein M0802_000104 [Mischocyttarus mexicanus]|nr:hypothetical protein M0802_000104 [Mischocyttarus mexicanus]
MVTSLVKQLKMLRTLQTIQLVQTRKRLNLLFHPKAIKRYFNSIEIAWKLVEDCMLLLPDTVSFLAEI